ncbi:MAG: Rne/Rng family ribonuclease [Clostridiales bacterium]|nr:Rne/Rng family ribonuclease [Clostridiales bacterium]
MNEIVVDVGINETRLALLENKELVELYIERKNNKRIVGNIYKGRIINILPGMQAAFVDIGLERNAFLYIKDAIPQNYDEYSNHKDISINDILKKGQEIVVQVIKEAIGTKGPRVTTHITLPGRYLVLMPYTDYLGISRKITDEVERERLREIVETIKPQNMGVIIRTVGEGKDQEVFNDDINFLLKLWTKISQEKKLGFPPRIIYNDFDLIAKTLRDKFTKDIDEFVINDKKEYENALELVKLISPSLKDRIKLYTDKLDIFQYYRVDSQIKENVDRIVWLKSGGYIVIDYTEALTVIDVNTGKYTGSIDLENTVFNTNIEAAKEIAKQLRLRDIGGIIIVDFIDMTREDYNKEVLEVLEKALEKDPTKTHVFGITSLGLVEITRKKVRQRLESLIHRKCPSCEGSGRVFNESIILHKIEKEIIRIHNHTTAEAVIFEVHPNVLEKIKSEEHIMQEIEACYDIKIWIIENIKSHYNDINIKAMGRLEVITKLVNELD